MKKSFVLSALLLSALSLCVTVSAKRAISVKSPDGKIRFILRVSGEALPCYDVYYGNTRLVRNGNMGFVSGSGRFGSGVLVKSVRSRSGVEKYDLVVGKSSHVEEPFRETRVSLVEEKSPRRCVDVVVRLFNDGAAFRYEFRKNGTQDSYVMYDELTSFTPSGNPDVLTMFLASYTTSHEGFYSRMKYSDLPSGKLMEMPALFMYGDVFMSVTEAAVRDYAGMYLMKENGALRGKLSPLPNCNEVKVRAQLPHKSPWRVMMISPDVGRLISSNILTNLNEPCLIKDVSWIKPGKTTFSWWNGNVVPDGPYLPGNNFSTNKHYIDFASSSGLEFHSIYGYAEQPWYKDENMSFEFPDSAADVTVPVRSLDMDAISTYASSKGVGLHLWVNWKPLYARLDTALAKFEQWGVRGMMVDFMDRDDQDMIRIQEEILKKAAEHKIFVQFHGSSKPSGLNRTYPNEFAREGTRNYECYKWSKDMGADLDIAIPFTRLLAGVTDYHLGGFRSVPEDSFAIRYTNPLVTSTRCHMLGMYVVLECYLGMVCDKPEAYIGQPGFEFIRQVPTSWDETFVPCSSVMEYVTVARRSGSDWYVGAINDSTPRTVSFKTDFLCAGTYEAEVYSDADDTDLHPNNLIKRTVRIDSKDTVTLRLAANGGAALRIRKIK